MPSQNPDVMAEGIARFLQTAEMTTYTEQLGSLKETIEALQADTQEISRLNNTVKSLQDSNERAMADIAALKEHYHQEISRLNNTVKSLQDFNERAEADIAKLAKLQDQHHQEIDSLKASSKANITQLRQEIAGLRAQRLRTEGSPVYGGSPRDHGTRQSAMQVQEPSGRQTLHSPFVRNKTEDQLFPRHETKANIQLHPFHDDIENRDAGPNRPLEQQYPRGIKRAHVDDVAETRHGRTTAEETSNPHGLEQSQSQKSRHTNRSDHKPVHDEVPDREMPNREQSRNSDTEDHSQVRLEEFVAYYHSKRKEYKKATVGRDKGALVRHFIEGIGDPAYCRWFQNALKEQFPERVHYAAHPTGKRFISVPRDLTWEDAKTVLMDVPIPYFRD